MSVKCTSCFWYDKDSSECIIYGYTILFPKMPRKCPFHNMVPRAAINYLEKMSEAYNGEKSKIYRSDTYKNYLRKMFRMTRVDETKIGVIHESV